MKKILRKGVNFLLVLSMLMTVIPGLCFTAHAEQAKVEIVSFVGKNNTNLRSSELLEVQITGYEGNISDLTFTWDNQLGTYLYIYNSSNMYNIKDTAGEIELYGKSVRYEWDWNKFSFITIEVPGESVSVKGYAWASVYGANLDSDSLIGSISVTVTDPKGNVIGSASYDKGFLNPSLNSDLKDTNYGIFEGETLNIKDMLGRSSIVHIDCTACKVSYAETASTNIDLVYNEDEKNYYVTGNTSGVAEIKLSLRKENCKFHQNSGEQTIENKVYVFKMPEVSTTTTTLELTNIDSNCEYFIGKTSGTKTTDGKVVFAGLTPDTTYEVTVRGNYEEGYAYAYVTGTTKPIFIATVNCYTDNVIADFIHYFGAEQNLFLKEVSKNQYISLKRTTNGVYSADVDNGIYYVYYKNNDSYARVGDYQITIDNENNSLNIYTYSLKYNLNGGTMDSKGGVHYLNSAVYATQEIPVKAKSAFLYWVDEDGKQYKPGQLITSNINKPYVLTAVWEDAVDVKVNITIDHSTENDGYDHAAGKGDIDFRLMRIDTTSSVPASDIISLTTGNCNGYDCVTGEKETKYTSNISNFEGKKGATYTISTTKSGYNLKSVNQTTQADGTIILDAVLEYEPNNFDLKFDVAMADDIPTEFYPEGVNVKVSFWGFDVNAKAGWYCITQHQNTSLYIDLDDKTGKGNGSYPVWNAWADKPEEPYYYRIEVVSYVLEDGSVVTNDDNAYKSDVTIVGGGNVPGYPEGADLPGSYFNGNAQVGIPTATISIESFNLTFNANGGKIKDSTELTLNNQVIIPDLLNYVPTREGGYRFEGWYKDSNFAVKAESGKRLYGDTTLYAKWKAPISVSGTITVDGFYFQDGKLVDVLDVDRARTLVVTLQVKNNNPYNDVVRINSEVAYNDIMSISSELTYDDETNGKITENKDGTATVNYNFENVPDMLSEGVEYRIRTAIINYETLYDNNNDKKFSADEFTASFEGSNAKVDAHLVFNADEFVQNFEIDATLIGEGYRPQNGITQVLFQTTGTNPPNTVISQHEVEPFGEEFTFGSDGVARDSLNLWKGISNGAISSYQLKITKIDDKEYGESLPYTIRYGATTSWNAANGKAETLKAAIVPKEYVVNLDINTTDEVGGMNDYKKVGGEGYFTTHKWSYNTPIAATPTRDGFIFVGWEAEEEGIFDGRNVQACVAENITLKAIWAEFGWVTDTDSGYFKTEQGKNAVVRFLFDVETTDEVKKRITKTGIKFIKSTGIADMIENSLVGDLSEGNSTTFYGDIKDIPESNAATKYYAVAYIICNGKTYWSSPIERGPAFDDLITYE